MHHICVQRWVPGAMSLLSKILSWEWLAKFCKDFCYLTLLIPAWAVNDYWCAQSCTISTWDLRDPSMTSKQKQDKKHKKQTGSHKKLPWPSNCTPKLKVILWACSFWQHFNSGLGVLLDLSPCKGAYWGKKIKKLSLWDVCDVPVVRSPEWQDDCTHNRTGLSLYSMKSPQK